MFGPIKWIISWFLHITSAAISSFVQFLFACVLSQRVEDVFASEGKKNITINWTILVFRPSLSAACNVIICDLNMTKKITDFQSLITSFLLLSTLPLFSFSLSGHFNFFPCLSQRCQSSQLYRKTTYLLIKQWKQLREDAESFQAHDKFFRSLQGFMFLKESLPFLSRYICQPNKR